MAADRRTELVCTTCGNRIALAETYRSAMGSKGRVELRAPAYCHGNEMARVAPGEIAAGQRPETP
jgi:hypothetical protein